MTNIRIASRGSKLALWQANYVKDTLEKKGHKCEIKVYKTTGDQVQDRFLHEIGGKGLFVKELEAALLKDEADIAVHSLKDLPAKTPEPFELCAFLPRHSPFDVMIFSKDASERLALPSTDKMIDAQALMLFGSLKIGTGSLRRTNLLKEASNTAEVMGLRGNVDTRIAKLDKEDLDAIILAEASLDRLSLKDGLYWRRLDPDWFTPSPSQGALVIECKKGAAVADEISFLNCPTTSRMVGIERGFLAKLGGDCTMPFGCYARLTLRETPTGHSNVFLVDAVVGNNNGKVSRASLTVPEEYKLPQEKVLIELEKKLLEKGGASILTDLENQKQQQQN